MRTKIIPAQITTVEDKIAGNLNLTQILILMFPIFWTALVYGLFIPSMQLAFYKVILVVAAVFLSLFLSLRIKGQIVFNWLITLFRFNLRAKYYVFNKNERHLRTLDLPVFERKPFRLLSKVTVKKKVTLSAPNFGIKELVQLENIVHNPKFHLRFQTKKGGLHVAFDEIPS